jgi:L-iditol 2-dehydrogenase
MLGVHFLGNARISIDEMPMPEPHGRWVVVKTLSAAICGTDRENLEGPGQPVVPGHESAGVVTAVDQPARLKVGDRVAVNCHVTCGHCEHCLKGDLYFCDALTVMGFDYDGGFGEYMLVPEASCMPLPDDITCEHGSLLVDMLGTSFRAVKRAQLHSGHHVAIWGAGPIGLGALMSVQAFGAKATIIDRSEYRLEMARRLGAQDTIQPQQQDVVKTLREWTGGRGIDVAFDCVGHQAVAEQGLASLRRRGTLAVVGVSHSLNINPWDHLICNEFTIYGSRNFNTSEFDEMIGLVRAGLPVLEVVTHRFAHSNAEEAFRVFREGECGKILFTAD